MLGITNMNRGARMLRHFFSNTHMADMDIGKYRFPIDGDVAADVKDRIGYSGDLLKIYTEAEEGVIHKWHHYLPLYDRYFESWRGKPVRFLEIGVSKGGSLSMWRRYFGEDAVIFGIDIDEKCREFDGHNAAVRIGSQTDKAFLEKVVAEMGGVDIVLDDGSHIMSHIKTSLECLFPMVNTGGVYMIEDLHTSYWRNWEGGYRRPENFFNYVRTVIDDMHTWYHQGGAANSTVSDNCVGIHIHDSICVLERGSKKTPTHSALPRS